MWRFTRRAMRQSAWHVIVYVLLVVYFAFFLVPMAWLFISSFKTPDALFSSRLSVRPGDLTLSNYLEMLSRRAFQRYFVTSFLIAGSVTLTTLMLSVLGGYGLSKYRIGGRNLFLVLILASQMFPPVLILIPFYEVIQTLRLNDTYTGVVLAHTILALPFGLWMIKGYFDGIPDDLVEAAAIDGCSRLDALWRVILPVSAPGVAVAAFYAFVVSWGDYLFVSILSQSDRTVTMPLNLQRVTTGFQVKWGQVDAATVITVVPVLILFALVQRWLVKGLLAGAVKG